MNKVALIGAGIAGVLLLGGCSSTVSGVGTHGSGSPPASSPGFPSSSAATTGENAALSPAELVRATKAAFTSATAFHMKGEGSDGTQSIAFDIHYGENSSDGSMSIGGLTVQLRYVRPELFMKAGEEFWKSVGGLGTSPSQKDQAALALLTDKWVRLPKGTAGLRQLGEFAIREKFLAQAAKDDETTTYSKGPSKTIHGSPAVSFVSDDGTVVYVPASGTPYPIRIEDTDSTDGGGTFDLTDWNAPFSAPSPPADQIVDLPK
jgi:hypothetical protein